MSIAQQIGIIGNSLKVNNLPEASATTYGTGNRFYTLVGTQDGFKTGHTYKTVNNDGVYSWADTKSVQNKLPLVVGYQDASNPYDITASDLDGVTEIKRSTFYEAKGLRSIELPSTCTSIGSLAFNSCTALIAVSMPNVTSVANGAFGTCTSLTSISMPNVTSIGNTFQYCSALTSVSMPKVASIGQNAFYSCTALTSLTIPSTCTSIGFSALQCGSSTNKCTFTFEGTTPPSIQTTTFDKSNLNKIIVPVGCGNTYKTATNWTNFASYIEEATE